MQGSRRVQWAVFLIAMSLLAFELVSTRLFSVILWNHFAFLAISIALFGFGVAGVLVFSVPGPFGPDRAPRALYLCAATLPFCIVGAVAIVCALPIRMNFSGAMFGYLGLIFLVTSVPFVVGGIAIALALTHWPRAVNRIYAYDLVGSALGCLLVLLLLGRLDGPAAAIALAILPAIAALVLQPRRAAVALLLLVVSADVLIASTGWVRVRVARSKTQQTLFEGWNAYSRVAVTKIGPWAGWYVSERSRAPHPDVLGVYIDGDAFTPLTRFGGSLEDVVIVLEDITAAAYHLHPDPASALVIGAGGGKDVLAALVAGARVRAVELNPIIARDIVGGAFREFTGDLYRHPRVDLVVGEGRTVLRHDPARYDVVQVSMVDTSAASAAGAYALTENSLYTVEAATEFLDHLNPGGIFTCTWANFPNLEGVNRLVSLYAEALRRGGAGTVHDKIAVLGVPTQYHRNVIPLATVLVRPDGIGEREARLLLDIAARHDFVPLYVPGREIADDPERAEIAVIREILRGDDREAFFARHPLDLRPVGDDRPFFFYQNRLRDIGTAFTSWNPGLLYGNGMFILAKLLVISGAAVLVFMGLPLVLSPRTGIADLRGSGPYLLYFLALGIGFIVIEIALVQRFGYYLGHPLLGLGVSLTTILLFTGIGSAIGGRFPGSAVFSRVRVVLVGIVALSAVYTVLLPPLVAATLGGSTLLRSGVAVLVLAPLGVLLGIPFPSGLRLLGGRTSLTPWVWAINGGASVFGATLATMVVMHAGFSVALLAGGAVYLAAIVALARFPAPPSTIS